MSEQGELVYRYGSDLPHNRRDTSIAAARDAEPNAGTDAHIALELIRYRGEFGLTDDELEVMSAMRHQTASARRRGLVLKGLVRDSGQRRPTRSGSMAIVWVAR